MQSYAITTEHWQAALEVPKQIALDLAAPLNLRLQAVRMVQAILKVILSDAKDREKSKPSRPSPKASEVTPRVTASPSVDEANRLAPVLSQQALPDQETHKEEEVPPVAASTEEETETYEADSAPAADIEQVETRPRYIGRVGPRKFRGKRKK
ncbi:hypothetical protein DTL42_00155 [Bremerella cremea]|uniref:Uncharacterized protein n=1 Tax=Bremerella cremea TaxID=1031537 RepID=A0A368KZY0_9BACT|nr:hypothetical protein [Bremerella cremea]RCS56174.1 hypothetical protein DTL42_00155 [Bremerella cremea]